MAQTWESGHACALPLWTGLDTLGHHGSIIVDGLPARTQECSARICMRDAPPWPRLLERQQHAKVRRLCTRHGQKPALSCGNGNIVIVIYQ